MALDGITMQALKQEFSSKLIGGKVQKINQINDHLIILNIYKNKNYKLLFSSNSENARIHITNLEYKNPVTPPNFCMVLRKHLQGSHIIGIEQNGLDRTMTIIFSARNELGDISSKKLTIDVMGKHSNIVLTKEDNTVIESIKRVSHDMSSVRAVYPGTKFTPILNSKFDITEKYTPIENIPEHNTKLKSLFYNNYTGFSPIITNEILYLSNLDSKELYSSLNVEKKEELENVFSNLCYKILNNNFCPTIYYNKELPANYYCMRLKHLGDNYKVFDSISEALDMYYKENVNDNSLDQKKNNLIKIISSIISKKVIKLDLMNKDLLEAQEYDKFRIEGDLLSINTNMINKGDTRVKLINYLNNEFVDISLDPKKTVWENINQKYKISKKLSKSLDLLKSSIPSVKEEISYLSNIKIQLNKINAMEEIDEIKEELVNQKYIKSSNRKNKKKEFSKSKPLQFSYGNSIIYVGKNNLQNEELTLKFANKNDYFFHIKDLPGSHVILRNPENPGDDLIYACAYLAALYSKYSNDKYIDVDYTEKKNVYKQKGSKPGMVLYNDYKTIRVNLEMEPNIITEIKNKE